MPHPSGPAPSTLARKGTTGISPFLFHFLTLALIFLSALSSHSAGATTYYVAPSDLPINPGRDTNTGTLSTSPWTLQKGVATAIGGDTVYLEDGLYKIDSTIEIQNQKTSPTSTSRVTLRAVNQRKAVLKWNGTDPDADIISINGSSLCDTNPNDSIKECEDLFGHDIIDGGPIYIAPLTASTATPRIADYITLDGLVFKDAPHIAVSIAWADKITVQNCEILDSGEQGIFTAFSNYTNLNNNFISGTKVQHGIYVSNGSDYPTISDNVLVNNTLSGIQINADANYYVLKRNSSGVYQLYSLTTDGISTGGVIERNKCFNNGSEGAAAINLAGVRNATIDNNLLANNLSTGIALSDAGFTDDHSWDPNHDTVLNYDWGCTGNKIYNNTVYFRHDGDGDNIDESGRYCLNLKYGSTGNDVKNNIFFSSDKGGIELDESSDFKVTYDASTKPYGTQTPNTADYNLYHSGNTIAIIYPDPHPDDRDEINTLGSLSTWSGYSGDDTHSRVTTDPQFVNPVAPPYDFRLESGSPAAQGGTTLTTISDYDLDYVKRNVSAPYFSWDIGSYESYYRALDVAVRSDGQYGVLYYDLYYNQFSINWYNASGTQTATLPGTPPSGLALTGWTARHLSVGPDNSLYLMWSNSAGDLRLQKFNSSGTLQVDKTFSETSNWPGAPGTRPGWAVQDMVIGPNFPNNTYYNKLWVLWTNYDGRVWRWQIDTSMLTVVGNPSPITPTDTLWAAKAVTLGSDSITRILWTRSDWNFKFWRLNASNTYTPSVEYYSPGGKVKDFALRSDSSSDNKIRVVVGSNNNANVYRVDNESSDVLTFLANPYFPVSTHYFPEAAATTDSGTTTSTKLLWSVESGGSSVSGVSG